MEIPEIMAYMAKLFSTRVFNGEKTIFSTNTAGNTRYHVQKKKKKMKLDFYSTPKIDGSNTSISDLTLYNF